MTLLEPIMKVVVTTPEEYVGSVSGDLSSRRGLISGTEDRANTKVLTAEVPAGVWSDMKAEGLIRADAPTPGA